MTTHINVGRILGWIAILVIWVLYHTHVINTTWMLIMNGAAIVTLIFYVRVKEYLFVGIWNKKPSCSVLWAFLTLWFLYILLIAKPNADSPTILGWIVISAMWLGSLIYISVEKEEETEEAPTPTV